MIDPEPARQREILCRETWPPLQESRLGSWRLGAGGHGRRANSCFALGDPGCAWDRALAHVVAWQSLRESDPCVRTSPASPAGLEEHLTGIGWRVAARGGFWEGSAVAGSEHPSVVWEQDSGWGAWTAWEGTWIPEGRARGRVRLVLGAGAVLYGLEVDEPWRGQGGGTLLLRACAAKARSAGCERLALQVLEGNPAQSLYRREGFLEQHRYQYWTLPTRAEGEP